MSCYQQQSILFDNFSYCAVANSCGNRDMELAYKTKTDLILYSGNNLSCTPVDKCDTVTEVFQAFNTQICPEAITLTIINEFINNEELASILCNNIIQKCIDCDALENCITCDVILECTTTTSTTTAIPPCSCITFSNSGNVTRTIFYTPCNQFDPPFILVTPGENTAQVCGSNPIPDFVPSSVTWTVSGPCVNVNGYNVCSDSCCNYTVTRGDDPVYINFFNCFGYWEYLEPDPNTTVSFCAIENQVFVSGGTAVKVDCNCVATCTCHEIDTVGGGLYTIRWRSCDGEDKAQSVYDNVINICAIPGTVTYNGTGPIVVINSGITCVIDGDCG